VKRHVDHPVAIIKRAVRPPDLRPPSG
jgi:hypothetical protein